MEKFMEGLRRMVKFNASVSELYAQERVYVEYIDDKNKTYIFIDIRSNFFNNAMVYKVLDNVIVLEIDIGNIGIHINNGQYYTHLHRINKPVMTEEEYFQFSLLNDVQLLEYQDYVDVINYQSMLTNTFRKIK